MSRDDELLDVLNDVFENGEEIPSRVTNRMLLAGIRKNYTLSSGNRKLLVGDAGNPGVLERLNLLETFKKNIGKFIWLSAGAVVAGFAAIAFGG